MRFAVQGQIFVVRVSLLHALKQRLRERSSGVGIVLQQLSKFLTIVDIKPYASYT